MTYASFGRRLGAHILDVLVLLPAIVALSVLSGTRDFALLLVPAKGLVFVAYTFLLHWKYGRTLGKRWMGLKVVTLNGAPLSAITAARRNVIIFIQSMPWIGATMVAISKMSAEQYRSAHGHAYRQLEHSLQPEWYEQIMLLMFVVLIAEVISVLVTSRKRSLHDFIGGTVVVNAAQLSLQADSPAGRAHV